MTANDIANMVEKEPYHTNLNRITIANFIRQQQAEIDRLNYDLDGFKQNFFVSGFHLQIKMANEQLVKQQDEIKDLKQQVAFLEDWRDTWSPTIKQLMNINVKVNDE